jgi:hypothetical protein
MADEPENHTIRLLREMREETSTRFGEMDRRFGETDRRFDEMRVENQRQHTETRQQLGTVLETVLEMAKAVNAIHGDVGDLRRGQKIIENELRGLRGRVERIEDRLDLAKA